MEVEAYEGGAGATGADVRWLVGDQLGTPRMVLDKTGSLAGVRRHDYLPFGEELSAGTGGRMPTQGYSLVDNVRQKFTKYERDEETQLDYAQARYYANVQGRFTSVDPEGASADIGDPQSWNAYTYARNNPLLYVDPDGRTYLIKHADGTTELVTDKQFNQLKNNPSNPDLGLVYKNQKIYSNGEVIGTYERVAFDDLTENANRFIFNLARFGPAMEKTILAFTAANLAPAVLSAAGTQIATGSGLVTLGNLARAATPVAGGGAAVLDKLSRSDASVFQRALELGASATNAFQQNLNALARAVTDFRADAQIHKIGQIGNSPVFGSLVSRVGIAQVNGQTVIVKMVEGQPQILGPLPK